MTTARREAVALLGIMKQAAKYELKRRGIGRRALSGLGRGAIGGAALGGGLSLATGLPGVISPQGESRKEALKTLLASVLAGSVGGAMLGAPIGMAGETLLGPRTRLTRTA